MPIDLNITSKVSYYTSKGPDFPGPLVSLKTRNDLEQVTVEQIPEFTKILSITTTTNFIIDRYKQSSTQTVYLSNLGTIPVSVHVSNMSFSIYKNEVVVYPKLTFDQNWSGPKTIIPPNETVSLDIAYKGVKPGLFNNVIVVNSNNRNTSTYDLIYTEQEVVEIFNFDIYPTRYTNTSTLLNEIKNFKFNIYPFNGTTSSYTTSLLGDPGFSISSVSTSSIVVSFNNQVINNINSTYTTILSVIANGIENTATISNSLVIDQIGNVYGSWLSPASPFNSIIGIVYAQVDSELILTIGVGLGADGSSVYGENNGDQNANLSNLGPAAAYSNTPYIYWDNVYRIPIISANTGITKTYKSSEYKIKSQNENYDFYFGDNLTENNMFLIDDDGYGNIQIRMNRLRELPENAKLATTIDNLSRAFYYYSDVDVNGRYTNLSDPVGDFNDRTLIFAGFNNQGQIITYRTRLP